MAGEITRIGSLVETAPASDTASSGLNGRMQRVAQRLTTLIGMGSAGNYETVAASQTDQVLGPIGAAGDYLDGLIIVPALVACGAVSIKDGGGSSIVVFVGGGTTALADAKPFFVPVHAKSAAGAWKVTTGASVSVIGVGTFAQA
jgi:hypothetical protein